MSSYTGPNFARGYTRTDIPLNCFHNTINFNYSAAATHYFGTHYWRANYPLTSSKISPSNFNPLPRTGRWYFDSSIQNCGYSNDRCSTIGSVLRFISAPICTARCIDRGWIPSLDLAASERVNAARGCCPGSRTKLDRTAFVPGDSKTYRCVFRKRKKRKKKLFTLLNYVAPVLRQSSIVLLLFLVIVSHIVVYLEKQKKK